MRKIDIDDLSLWLKLARFAVLFMVLCSFAWEAAIAEQVVNISIDSSEKEIELRGRSIAVNSASGYVTTTDRVLLKLKGRSIFIANKSYYPPLRLVSKNPIFVGKRSVRGELLVIVESQKDKLTMILVHPIPLETYVAGIVASEVPTSWPDEALRAQAIASRTYAVFQKYKRIDQKVHMSSTVMDQVYGGLEKEHTRAQKAAEDTYGLVLTFEAKPIQAFFHSSCGGRTASAKEGWGSDLEYLPGSKCGFCENINAKEWELKLSKKYLEDSLKKYGLGPILSVSLGSKTPSGRVEKIGFNGKSKKVELDAAQFRAAIGYGKLRSTMMSRVVESGDDIIFYGKGFGHGVGMCQWGANGMAKAGYIASDILARYYPGSELRRMY